MNGAPLLTEIAKALNDNRLEAILIGGAAAALQGAPVTTLDFDFMFRKTPTNLRKLKGVARNLEATIFHPYYPVSGLYRVIADNSGLQLDFLSTVHGVKSFAALRSRATEVVFGPYTLWVASLADIINSKRAVGRGRDQAVLDVLEKTLHEKENLTQTTIGGAQKRKRKSVD